jgi:hypothetical protein
MQDDREGAGRIMTPPGVAASTFQAAIRKYRDAIGKERVFVEEDDVNLYRDACSRFWAEEDEKIPSAGRCGIRPKHERVKRGSKI